MLAQLRSSFSDRRIAVVASLAILSLFVIAMMLARVVYTETLEHTWIAWNLFLAWVPFVLSLVAYARARPGMSGPKVLALGGLWLLFFPNAPYIVTDLKHIGGATGRVPILYDVLLLSAAAWTGLLLGLTSLYLMHAVARRFVGVLNAWALVIGVLAASSYGIYLGRFQRWNSWDLFVRPGALLAEATQGFHHARPMALTVLLTSFLLASYLVFYSFARMSALIRD